MRETLSRREAARRGLVAGGAFVAIASASSLPPVRAALAWAGDDRAVLEAAVRLEQTAVVAYDTASEAGLLARRATGLARLLRDQEQAHADALSGALKELGGTAPPLPAPSEIDGLARVTTQRGFVRFAMRLERQAVAAYYDAQCTLGDAELLSLAARIMANEGQHLALLRPLAGDPPVPHAFERGVA